MNLKSSLYKQLLFAGMARMGLFTLILLLTFFIFIIDGKQAFAAVVDNPSVAFEINASLPKRLKIPRIKVDAAVESIGLTINGEVGVPKGPTHVAWFNEGPRPGNSGSAVMSGHFGPWGNGLPTVFNNLSKMRKGDKVFVKDDKGATFTFVVTGLKTYGLNDNAPEVFITSDGKSRLNLVTCQGVWNKKARRYSQRLVVFTEREAR